MSEPQHHLLINGLSIGTGGGYTVGRELLRHLALARPKWRVTIVLSQGHPLQESMAEEELPENCALHWAPPIAVKRWGRRKYEAQQLPEWAKSVHAEAVVQLNGMIVPQLGLPALCHAQDPWPYRPQAWQGARDRFLAWLKRRQQRRALRQAAIFGWTSNYLRELICTQQGIWPDRGDVFYNGVAEDWIERARGELPAWETRPLELATVSNVSAYKRQSLVIQAVARLRQEPDLKDLTYRIIGACTPEYEQELTQLAVDLGIGPHVVLEGRVSDQRVQEVLRSARAMPLMSVCESFGIPTIEAMSYGTPVVIADCCALPEVCGDNAALRVPIDDVDALVEQLGTLLRNPELAKKLQKAGAGRVQQFRWSDTAEKMAVQLEDVMGRRAANRVMS